MTSSLSYDIIQHIETFVQKKDSECFSPTSRIMKRFINDANGEYLSDLKKHIETSIFFNLGDMEAIENLHPDYHHRLTTRISNNHQRIMKMIKKYNLLKILKNNVTLYTKRKYKKKFPPIGYFHR